MTHTWGQYLAHRRSWMLGQRAPGARVRNTGGGLGAGPRGIPGGGRRLPAAVGDVATRPAGPGIDTGGGPAAALQDWWDSTVVATNRWCAVNTL